MTPGHPQANAMSQRGQRLSALFMGLPFGVAGVPRPGAGRGGWGYSLWQQAPQHSEWSVQAVATSMTRVQGYQQVVGSAPRQIGRV